MAKAVFTHRDGSIYDDLPEWRYHFPRTYLNAVRQTEGDWIVYYEPRRDGGRKAYFATARVARVERDPTDEGHFYAYVEDYAAFPSPPGFIVGGVYLESSLRKDDGSTNKGAFGRSVRLLPEHEFDAICALGFAGVRADLGGDDWAAAPGAENRAASADGLAEAMAPFQSTPIAPRPMLSQIVSRRFRDAAFARQVKSAYAQTCAMTGLRILNGGGRPEVEAAHIRPVADDGPDTVRNGLALSGTAHWMFDRGLASVDDDLSILVARDRLPDAAARLLNADGRLIAPQAAMLRPHPRFLNYHRRAIFKG